MLVSYSQRGYYVFFVEWIIEELGLKIFDV